MRRRGSSPFRKTLQIEGFRNSPLGPLRTGAGIACRQGAFSAPCLGGSRVSSYRDAGPFGCKAGPLLELALLVLRCWPGGLASRSRFSRLHPLETRGTPKAEPRSLRRGTTWALASGSVGPGRRVGGSVVSRRRKAQPSSCVLQKKRFRHTPERNVRLRKGCESRLTNLSRCCAGLGLCRLRSVDVRRAALRGDGRRGFRGNGRFGHRGGPFRDWRRLHRRWCEWRDELDGRCRWNRRGVVRWN